MVWGDDGQPEVKGVVSIVICVETDKEETLFVLEVF